MRWVESGLRLSLAPWVSPSPLLFSAWHTGAPGGESRIDAPTLDTAGGVYGEFSWGLLPGDLFDCRPLGLHGSY